MNPRMKAKSTPNRSWNKLHGKIKFQEDLQKKLKVLAYAVVFFVKQALYILIALP